MAQCCTNKGSIMAIPKKPSPKGAAGLLMGKLQQPSVLQWAYGHLPGQVSPSRKLVVEWGGRRWIRPGKGGIGSGDAC